MPERSQWVEKGAFVWHFQNAQLFEQYCVTHIIREMTLYTRPWKEMCKIQQIDPRRGLPRADPNLTLLALLQQPSDYNFLDSVSLTDGGIIANETTRFLALPAIRHMKACQFGRNILEMTYGTDLRKYTPIATSALAELEIFPYSLPMGAAVEYIFNALQKLKRLSWTIEGGNSYSTYRSCVNKYYKLKHIANALGASGCPHEGINFSCMPSICHRRERLPLISFSSSRILGSTTSFFARTIYNDQSRFQSSDSTYGYRCFPTFRTNHSHNKTRFW
ncbi:hypothetical protein BJ875DRAFT_81474 [Amylocarpus encephaloides]|uniref:Uncharacterized protein n=1 Tax=Amylocarpus encephaloides TaxID=45428 RepID=A0A9P8C3Q8_9HELO|nr:hypothetical protein BJ875DRAFT_81474 [Amylocarpus encephaloides]